MAIFELADITWWDFRYLARSGDRGAVAVLPVGAIEAHGPHLPLGTDVVIARAMARSGGEKLARDGYTIFLLPPLAFTAAGFARNFPGTIALGPETVSATVVQVGASLKRHGVEVLALANAHFDPGHLAALHEAARRCREEENLTVAFPDLTRKPWAVRLTEEFQSGACHAGRYEGSIVLAEAAELVRRDRMDGLAPNPVSLKDAIAAGKRTFEEAGGPGGELAYFGYPSEATAEEGRKTVEVLGQILRDAVLSELGATGR
ncbi:MAG: creatinine amidohydrolase [Gemmatimonadales bacterium]|nr:Creatinine amidohydrolase [bacterium HR33]GIW53068.1 MAG: creatinine amidohydrolase [Gemmatimonadales bacterium]